MPPSGELVPVEEGGAFVRRFSVAPTAPGPLSGLTFAVKDLIDMAGRTTGCGNPTWEKTHTAAAGHGRDTFLLSAVRQLMQDLPAVARKAV